MIRPLLVLIGIVILAPVLAIVVVFVGLNTGAGRAFAEKEINHFAAGQITISGLAGHFPADLKLAHLNVTDANGVWLTGDALELRWNPEDLLARQLHVTSLTAATISVSRAPAASATPSKSGKTSVPAIRLAVDHLEIGTLNVGAALAGTPVTLAVSGNAHLQSLTQADATLQAVAANGKGDYQVDAAMDGQRIDTVLHVAEPPDGLLGHFAGPKVNAPLALDLSLAGPRDDAALNFTAALGAAKLDGAGTLGLDPNAPKADVVFTVPALAPVAAIAGQTIAGSTKLHLIAAQRRDHGTDISLIGDVALNGAPGPAAKLVGPDGHISLVLVLANQAVNIQQLDITGAGFSLAAAGSVAQTGPAPASVDLNTHLSLTDVAAVSPGISGSVAEDGTIIGTAENFAVSALLTGDIEEPGIPSGPFNIAINATDLPDTPHGTLTASGALENAPLLLDAAFARDAAGGASVKINNALWRSLSAQADLSLAAGAVLPTGTAKFAVGRLADFNAFSPVKLAGSVTGDFSHADEQNFTLNLKADRLVVAPQLGAINATLHADGPVAALAVRLQATIAKLLSAPARLATAGVLNLDDRSARLSALSASWRGLNANLQGPAAVETRSGLAIRHLALGLNGGAIRLDGTLTPRINARLAVADLPASIAGLFAPAIAATGTLSATANVTGTAADPAGDFTLHAAGIKLHSGPAAALAPADLSATATLRNQTANLAARLTVGPEVTLNAAGLVPLTQTGRLALHLTGNTDLRLTDPILAAQGTTVRGTLTPDITVTGTPAAPLAAGTITLAGGSVENLASGLNLTHIAAILSGRGRDITLQKFAATAGGGTISGQGSVDLDQPGLPIDLSLSAANATPVSSDIVTETVNAALTLKGALRGALALGGSIDILGANINIPKSLPPSVADLPILNRGETPPPPPAPPPNIGLNLLIHAKDRIFVRGDGLFAELGGRLRITGTAAAPDPEGGFTLIRGDFSLAGRNLQFTQGTVGFNGDGFMPTLDLEATATNSSVTSTLIVGGTAAAPTITLTSTPPLPSDEILANLLFGTGTQNLTAFQAASLAAALAQLSGVGGGANPLDSIRSALGLDELALGGSGSGPPSIQAGRYVAPGVYVGAAQATNGQGTQATVQINLYKGLKLTTATGTSTSSAGASSSVGLTYQFNY